MDRSHEPHALACQYGLPETHLVHPIIHHHFQVVHLDNLLPKIRKERKRQITVHNCRLIGAFRLGPLHVDMYPLVVECSIGKLIDAFLRDFEVIGDAYHLPRQFCKIIIRINDYFFRIICHIRAFYR